MDEPRAVLERAFRYPYPQPAGSFVLDRGSARPPGAVELGPVPREPLLAYGSNASPEALARKLGDGGPPVAAERRTLSDHDVVYSAHLSPYGAVPATLVASPGTSVAVFVLALTEAQRLAIAASEPNYEPAEVDGLPAYLSRHGPLAGGDGRPLALAAIPARGRRLAAIGQRGALELARDVVAPGEDLESFVLDTAADPALARRRSELLRSSRSAVGPDGRWPSTRR